jgi:hypothetical protein
MAKMLLLEGYTRISNFTCARYCFPYVEFSDCYVKQSLAGQTLLVFKSDVLHEWCVHINSSTPTMR